MDAADAAEDIRGGGPVLLSFLPPLEELELVGGRETGVELLDDWSASREIWNTIRIGYVKSILMF